MSTIPAARYCQPALTARLALSMGNSKFRPTTKLITKAFVTGDYVGDPYTCANFGANPSTRGLYANRRNKMKLLFIYTHYSGLID